LLVGTAGPGVTKGADPAGVELCRNRRRGGGTWGRGWTDRSMGEADRSLTGA